MVVVVVVLYFFYFNALLLFIMYFILLPTTNINYNRVAFLLQATKIILHISLMMVKWYVVLKRKFVFILPELGPMMDLILVSIIPSFNTSLKTHKFYIAFLCRFSFII